MLQGSRNQGTSVKKKHSFFKSSHVVTLLWSQAGNYYWGYQLFQWILTFRKTNLGQYSHITGGQPVTIRSSPWLKRNPTLQPTCYYELRCAYKFCGLPLIYTSNSTDVQKSFLKICNSLASWNKRKTLYLQKAEELYSVSRKFSVLLVAEQ